MKKAGQILKEMGFRKEAPDSLKEAFIRHLIKSATEVSVLPGPNEQRANLQSKAIAHSKQNPIQLSFDFSEKISNFDNPSPAEVKKTS